MTNRTLLLDVADSEWDIWLDRTAHDFYHTASYHAFAERAGEGSGHMVVHGSPDRFIAWPYLVRRIDNEHADATSVYGYTGPVGSGLGDDAFRERTWRTFCEMWRAQGLVTLFTRFHPLLCNAEPCAQLQGETEVPGGEVRHLGQSVSIDLSLDRDARRSVFTKVLRQEIASAERKGLRVELDSDWSEIGHFGALYRRTMDRNDAADRYLFSDRYFAELRATLSDTAHLLVGRIDGAVAGAVIFTVCGPHASAHLIGTDEAYRHLSPAKCLVDGIAEAAREMGGRHLHLGAGRGGHEDSLFAFKARFSPRRHDFHLGRWILDAEGYDTLLRRAAVDQAAAAEFFPAYRAESRVRRAG